MTDAELLRAYRETHAEQAFAEIVLRHGAMVLRTCRRVLGNGHEAEDAAQAAFVVLARRPTAVQSPLPAWLHWVARNTSLNLVRARERRAYHEKTAGAILAMDRDAAPDHLREEVDAALAALPETLRQAVILRYLEGRTQHEAASMAGCPQGTMGRLAAEGLARLRAILHQRGTIVTSVLLTSFLAQVAAGSMRTLSFASLKLLAARCVPDSAAEALAETTMASLVWSKAKIASLLVVLGFIGIATLTVVQAWKPVAASPGAAVPLVTPPPFQVLLGPEPNEKIICPADTAVFNGAGNLVAFGRCDGLVKVLDRGTGRVRAFQGHRDRVRCVAFAPDGQLLASASWDQSIRLWDVATGEVRAVLRGHQNLVWSVAFCPNGKWVGSAGWDGKVKIWRVGAQTEHLALAGHRGRAYVVAFSPAGRLVASSGSDGAARLWDLSSGRERGVLKHDRTEVTGMAFSPDGGFLATACLGQGICLWDMTSGRRLRVFGKPETTSVAFSPDGQLLAATGQDRITSLWNPQSGQALGSCQGAGCFGASVHFTADGKSLAVAGEGCVLVLDPEQLPPKVSLRPPQ